ncbi:hypothetical protein EWE75_07530 [Sphingomonas populi]|uniref:Uncharacterized protein n=1 Tax=Sphingomonas populi TaxID=2484750 RepID=A0A4Q6XXQ2_9SPHN|nr:hypothetical protein [Sphingomonas populi]RZF65210.1 hypothetical protein EWE75_07530 [Sphingomonas populi]
MAYMQHDCFQIVGALAPTASRRVNTLSPLEREVAALGRPGPFIEPGDGQTPFSARFSALSRQSRLPTRGLHQHGRREAQASGEVFIAGSQRVCWTTFARWPRQDAPHGYPSTVGTRFNDALTKLPAVLS